LKFIVDLKHKERVTVKRSSDVKNSNNETIVYFLGLGYFLTGVKNHNFGAKLSTNYDFPDPRGAYSSYSL